MEEREDGYLQIVDEEGFEIESEEMFRLKCCDCGLIHEVVLVSEDGNNIGVAMRRVSDERTNTTK